MAKGKDWQETKLLCVPIIWLGLTLYIVANVVLPVIKQYWMCLFANFAIWILICIFIVKEWWYKEPFEGLKIHVREPNRGFDKMSYEINPAEVGTNPFGAAFAWHFSTVVIPLESAIHLFMGNDLQRASMDGNNEACVGMMTQEVNHGTGQLFYSRGVEKCLGYPVGYRTLWKIIMIRWIPREWVAAMILWIEVANMSFHLSLTLLPIKLEQILGEPIWLWTWHLMEESEHSWGYVHETGGKIPWIHKAVTWVVMAFGMLTFWTQAILQGLWYGRATFWKHPSRLVTGSFVHFAIFSQLLLFAITLAFMESLLGMRPDKAYQWSQSGISKEFETYSHLFTITHTQAPGGHLIEKPKKMPPRSSIVGVGKERQRIYSKVMEMMKSTGMTDKEIKRTSFSHVAEAPKFNPLL